ncbi:MAG: IS1380 family transposase [Alphaproteobacteria bacterium]|nr:IS1380 family transposase [Alphaproteobacteria bacterium]
MRLTVEGTDEILTSNSGLAVAGALLKSLKIGSELNKIKVGISEPDISNQDVFRSYIGLLVMGRTNYDDIKLFSDDDLFRIMLDIKRIPSSETLRQRFDGARGKFDAAIRSFNVCLLKECPLSSLSIDSGKYLPVDIDVSCFDNSGSKKEGVSWTYKRYDGYAPNFAYAGLEGYMVNCELRPGKQHCQKGTPEFIRDTISIVEEAFSTRRKVLFRFDSGNDSDENIAEFKDKENLRFIIKRNLRKEPLDVWLMTAMAVGDMEEPRPGKKVWTGEVFRDVNGYGTTRMVFRVVQRTTDSKGQAYLLPDIEVETYWTNLTDRPGTIVDLYHAHGTSEQFHSELKSDMDVERLPSGKFLTNSLVLKSAMIAFNVLRKMGCDLLSFPSDLPVKLDVGRRRIRSVMQNLVNVAGKLVKSGGRIMLKISRKCPWFDPFERLFASYC